MSKTVWRAGVAWWLGATVLAAQATTIYDPASNSKPNAQGWITQGFGFADGIAGGSYAFATTGNPIFQAGSARTSPFALDTQAGFRLEFRLRVLSEAHAPDNQRAGFSFIVTGNDPKHALELAFWDNRVWAYDYQAGFVPGPGKDLDTKVWRHYALVVGQQQYSFSADGVALFSGAMQDYTTQGAPYAAANFLFFGDDTTRAGASVELGAIQLAAVPEPAHAGLLLLGLAALGWRLRRR
jgi:PEP-CTERM motif